jgi:hypothetical protein
LTTDTEPTDTPPNAAALYFSGTMTERANMLIGMLTNAAVESLFLAGGNCPELTEQGYAERKAYAASIAGKMAPPPAYKGAVTPYLAARSACLRDAVRASEAVARLIASHTNTRKAYSSETVATVDEWQDGDKRRRRVRTVQRFGLAPEDSVIDAAAVVPPSTDSVTESASA